MWLPVLRPMRMALMPGDETQAVDRVHVVTRPAVLHIVEMRAAGSVGRTGISNNGGAIDTFEGVLNNTPPPTRFTVWRQSRGLVARITARDRPKSTSTAPSPILAVKPCFQPAGTIPNRHRPCEPRRKPPAPSFLHTRSVPV